MTTPGWQRSPSDPARGRNSKDQAPSFSSDSIENSANGSSASLSPNGIANVYGVNLARSAGAVSLDDAGAGEAADQIGRSTDDDRRQQVVA